MIGDILQPTHLLLIFVVALLVLGPKRLPEVGRSLGKGLRDFRGALAGMEEHASSLLHDEEPTPAAAPTPTAVPAVAATAVTPPPTVVASSSHAPAPTVVSATSHEPDPSDYAD